MAESEKKKFKDWFDEEAVDRLAEQFSSSWEGFDTERFRNVAASGLEQLEMSGRVDQIAGALAEVLPDDRDAALEILSSSLPLILPDCDAVTDGWLQWPLGAFIAAYGTDHVDTAFSAMIELTQRFSSEFAIRPFVLSDPLGTIARLQKLTTHASPHVRRWCSEGIRPRLPWGGNIPSFIEDPTPLWPILEALRADPELYVRRSVANNLNDISKDHPEDVLRHCQSWWGESDETDHMIRHALRTMVKDGHPGALALMGYEDPKGHVEANLQVIPSSIPIGNSIELNLTLRNTGKKPFPVLIDFGIEYVRKKGHSAKVFKWTTRELSPGNMISLKKRHAVKETTIRALYPGKHPVWVQVNGHECCRGEFTLHPKPGS